MKLANISLNVTETEYIRQLISELPHPLAMLEPNAQHLLEYFKQIPALAAGSLQQLQQNLIDSVIINNLPETLKLEQAKTLAFALSLLVGEPFQYLQQNNGEVVAEVKPLPGYEHTISSGGKVMLGWHTDDCMIAPDSRPQWIQLSGYYNPDQVATNIAFIADIIPLLSEQSLHILMTQPYKLIIPASFRIEKIWVEVGPLLKLNQDNNYEVGISAYQDIKCPNQASHDALIEFMNLASKCKYPVNLQPGKAIFFNNSRVLHSRDPIPQQRLVFRTYMINSLQGLRKRTGSTSERVFDLKYLI